MNGNRTYVNARITPAAYIHSNVMTEMECRGDDCRCRKDEAVHPPVLMTFRPELGKYLPAPMRCVARWAVSAHGHDAGRICGENATHQVADILVCEHHYSRIRVWMNERDKHDIITAVETARRIHHEESILARERAAEQRELDRETARLRAEQAKELARQQIELDHERVRAEEAARAESSRVYYVQRESDGLIKIGTSRTLVQRLATLKRESGPLRLIALEGGAHKEETTLHRKFAALRAEGEWFRPELPLLEHVYALMKEHPVAPARGLPPVMERRAIGSIIHKIKMEPTMERRRQHAAYKEERRRRRLERKQAEQAQTAADPAA